MAASDGKDLRDLTSEMKKLNLTNGRILRVLEALNQNLVVLGSRSTLPDFTPDECAPTCTCKGQNT